jgi:hypothetical protein
MNKMFLTLAAAAAFAAGSALAQSPPPAAPVVPASASCPTAHLHGGHMIGGHGFGHMGHGVGVGHGHGLGAGLPGFGLFGGLFTNHGKPFGRRHHGDPANAQTLPVATSGTLVFPQNPFIRSPRDFFMYYDR